MNVRVEYPSSRNNQIKLSVIVKSIPKDLRSIAGKKLNLVQKVALTLSKLKMKRWLKKHPDLTLEDYLRSGEIKERKFSWLWFAGGLLSVLLGIFFVAVFESMIGLFILPVALIALAFATRRSQPEKTSLVLGLVAGGIALLVLMIIAYTQLTFA